MERAVGIIEGGKWFLGPPTVVWLATAVLLRRRRVGAEAGQEFFVRYAVAFCLSLPVAQAAYFGWFGSFDQPSGLGDGRLAQVAVGAIVLTVTGTVTLTALDPRRRTLPDPSPASR